MNDRITGTRRRSSALIAALAFIVGPVHGQTPDEGDTGRLWRHRNLGTAYVANGAHTEAASELRLAAALAPESAGDALNAGIAALLAGELAGARDALEAAWSLDSTGARIAYARGILEKRDANLDAARTSLLRARELGASGPELHYNLGILAVRMKEPEAARGEFQAILDLGPDRAPRHYPSALYRFGRTLLQLREREEGAAALRRYQALVQEGKGAELTEEQLEQGELLELVEFDRPLALRSAGALPAFRLEALPGGAEIRWAEVADLDGDGDRDLLHGNGQTIRDLRREESGWIDVTASRGLAGLLGVSRARALDVDGDGQLDLVRSGAGGLHLHPGIAGGWDPPLPVSAAPVIRFVPVDFDHEGDLDFLVVGSAGPRLVRNNGDRSFEDVTGPSGLAVVGPSVGAVAGDLDDDRDVDFAFVTRRGEVVLASNERGGRFAPLAALTALPEGVFDLVLSDLDGDGDLDLAAATPRGVFVADNRGGFLFQAAEEPALPATMLWPSTGGGSLFAGDLDNDGLTDLLAALEGGAAVAINEGSLRFLAADECVRSLADANVRPVALALADADTRLDMVTSRSASALALNVGNTHDAIVLAPRGVKNNRGGVGAIFELLAGSRYARRDADGKPVHFGLGPTGSVDALRVQWPNGIQQAILDARPGKVTEVEEKAGLVGSCPFLYTWNGREWEYLTDILTVTPLGLPIAPGSYVPPDHDEAIRVTSDQLAPDANGDLVAQVTEELREVTYLDQVRLYAVDHPAGTEVQPNEKFKFPPFPAFAVHALQDARPPRRAIDHRGRDVTGRLLDVDDLVVGDLPLTRYQGITRMHSLVLDFGDVPADVPLTLHLAGWFFWTNASINMAISQNPDHDFVPPQLEVRRASGEWEALPIEVGFPGGKTKSIPVDLTGFVPAGPLVLRISTTLRLYWDRALLQVGAPDWEPAVSMHLPSSATLRYRGHSEPILSATGEEPERFDYERMRRGDVPWSQHPGRYTKYGDVTPLVQQAEDMYVIMASGDECTVRWRASDLPAVPAGHERTYFLVFDGWAKDGDPNTTLSSHVEPLPFHAMSGYPYGPDESYPDDEAHSTYRATWNTREAVPLTRDLAHEARQAAGASRDLSSAEGRGGADGPGAVPATGGLPR